MQRPPAQYGINRPNPTGADIRCGGQPVEICKICLDVLPARSGNRERSVKAGFVLPAKAQANLDGGNLIVPVALDQIVAYDDSARAKTFLIFCKQGQAGNRKVGCGNRRQKLCLSAPPLKNRSGSDQSGGCIKRRTGEPDMGDTSARCNIDLWRDRLGKFTKQRSFVDTVGYASNARRHSDRTKFPIEPITVPDKARASDPA